MISEKPGGRGGGVGGGGGAGDGGGGGGAGEGEGGGGDGEGGGGEPSTMNVADWNEPDSMVMVWPKPVHVLPLQPSPYESVIVRVHAVPPATLSGVGG